MALKDVHSALSAFPRLAFAQLPSPVFSLDNTTASGLHGPVYVKNDGVCATSYAGNKVRKLEFLLAAARDAGAAHVVTLGAAGSNHAVATSTYAHQLGMRCTACLSPQPPSEVATLNLRRHLALGTELKLFSRFGDSVAHAHALAEADDTYLVPLGGSSPLASLGYIAAAAELSEQIDAGLLPRPERIYVACGTMGTAVGLVLGMALLELPIEIVAVRVTERSVASPQAFEALYADSVALLHARNVGLKVDTRLKDGQVTFTEAYFGRAYAEPTPEALEAIAIAREHGLTLDGTYTGKAFAALIADQRSAKTDIADQRSARTDIADQRSGTKDIAQQGSGSTAPVLFWCTLNAVDTPMAARDELRTLGEAFQPYW